MSAVRPWKPLATIASLLLLALCAPAQAGNLVTVDPGDDVQAVLDAASPGDVVEFNPGTYTQPLTGTFSAIHITKALTLRAANPANRPTITADFSPANQIILILASDVTLDGFFVIGGLSGVVAVNTAPATLSGITIRNVDISANDSGAGHAINLVDIVDSDIESNTITAANNNGINLEPQVGGTSDGIRLTNNQISNVQHGVLVRDSTNVVLRGNTITSSSVTGILLDSSSGTLVHGNSVSSSGLNGIHALDSTNSIISANDIQITGDHGIAIQASNGTQAIANSIHNAIGFTGILIHDSMHCRIDRNEVSDTFVDGITFSDDRQTMRIFETSPLNYIGSNLVSSVGFAMGRDNGTGIWLNSDTYGNYVFGNSVSGFPEAGVSIWSSSSNTAIGNVVTDNQDGGIFVDDAAPRTVLTTCAGQASSCTGTNNLIHANHAFDNAANGQVHLRGAIDTQVAYNFLSAAAYPDPLNTPGSVKLGDAVLGSSAVSGAEVFANVMADFEIGEIVSVNVSDGVLFRNRHFAFDDTFSLSVVDWDAGSVLGGNHWSGHAAGGDPGSIPFCDIISDAMGGTGSICDTRPFSSESLGEAYHVEVYEPYAGTRAAAGSIKTIRWKSQACVYVDVAYASSASSGAIASDLPDIGYFTWEVPELGAATDYRVTVTCKNSAQAGVGVSAMSDAFEVGFASLRLMSPGRSQQVDTSATLRVVWDTGAGFVGPGVNVFLDTGSGFSMVGSTSDAALRHLDVSLPAASTNRARVYVVDQGEARGRDSTDGRFTIRGSAGAVTALFDPEGRDLLATSQAGALAGQTQIVEWKSVQGAELVDLSYFDGTSFVSLVQEVDDVGHFQWSAPADPTPSAVFRVVFRDAAGAVLSTVDSPTFVLPEPSRALLQLGALLSALLLRAMRRPRRSA